MTQHAQSTIDYAVVVPTIGRPSLQVTLAGLAGQAHPPSEVVIVDDRPAGDPPLSAPAALTARCRTRVVAGPARGPAAARNLGWQVTRAPWVVFVDDDVEVPPDWSPGLLADLADAPTTTGGVQAVVHVPLPQHRRPTDWERNTAGLAVARWITAEMAFRREALVEVSGFDERFPRAYREDSDLALRLQRAGWSLRQGDRVIVHPVRPAGPWISVRLQRGNADDALMRRLHGPAWRRPAAAGPGRMRSHLLTVGFGCVAVGGALCGRTSWGRRVAAAGAAGWLTATVEFAVRRIVPGPRTPTEIGRMAVTSALIPWSAVAHAATGRWRHRHAQPWPLPVRAVLFDRDGTLIENEERPVDPARVRPLDGAPDAVAALRTRGIATGVVTNQGAVGEGRSTVHDVAARNAAVERAIGPFDTWQTCLHRASDGCGCRKPAPGMIRAAARALGIPAGQCVVIGDTEGDILAARRAGARAVLVPNAATRAGEVDDAPQVAPDLTAAVRWVLQGAQS
ncbi:HAD-IIIA family hydrolase [Flexivirga lutea]